MRYFSITDDTSYRRQMPEIYEIVDGLPDYGPCPECDVNMRDPTGDLRVILGSDRARIWPDLIACGSYPCFVASGRFVDAMRESNIRIELAGRVDFIEPHREWPVIGRFTRILLAGRKAAPPGRQDGF